MKTETKKKLLLIPFALLIYILAQSGNDSISQPSSATGGDTVLQEAYSEKESDLQIRGEGVVVKVLPDDNKGLRHQKFILRISPQQTVLVAHNIDIAKRVAGIKEGDIVEFYGEYEWTPQGGVIHWTHFDPDGRHIHGWLRHNGVTYQ